MEGELMGVFENISIPGHEMVNFFQDESVGLRSIIAVHNSTLGPTCGGLRIWPYESEEAALQDVLNLSRAMTYKSAMADLELGGGKAVIWLDQNQTKTEELIRSYAKFLDTLGGKYITTTDVGSDVNDLQWISKETNHVVGLPVDQGGSGDTSIMTGLGVYLGMKACANHLWGSDSLEGKTVAFQGFGKVAKQAAIHLAKEGVNLVATDIDGAKLEQASDLGASIVSISEIYDVQADIFSPCALGGTINSNTIPRLSAQIIAGGANNQLESDATCEILREKGIVYAPDYVINAGGIINASCEIGSEYSEQRSLEKTEKIFDITLNILDIASDQNISTVTACDQIVSDKLSG